MIPVHEFMPATLAAILRKAPLTPEKVAFAWRQAVGPAVERATVVLLDGSILKVRVQNAQWQREVERSAGLIRSRLDALLGAGAVRGLDVTVDRPDPRASFSVTRKGPPQKKKGTAR